MDINKEIAYNKRLIKKINIEVNKIKRQPVSFTLSFEEKELKVLKTYLHAFKQLKVKNNIVRSLKRPFQYIEPLLSIKSSLIRHNCFNFKKEIIESCESFLYPSRIFLQDPTQLYPMIDLLEEVCYNCDIKLNQDGVNMWKFIKPKKLKMDETLICEEHTSSATITETIYNCVVSEIKRNFKSSAKASELIDYAIFLIGKELQNQFLFRMFYGQ